MARRGARLKRVGIGGQTDAYGGAHSRERQGVTGSAPSHTSRVISVFRPADTRAPGNEVETKKRSQEYKRLPSSIGARPGHERHLLSGEPDTPVPEVRQQVIKRERTPPVVKDFHR